MVDTSRNGSFIENIYVRFGAVVAGVIFLGGLIVHETTFRTNLTRDIQELRKEVIQLSTSLKDNRYPVRLTDIEREVAELETRLNEHDLTHWSRDNMRLWILETERINPNWHPAEIK